MLRNLSKQQLSGFLFLFWLLTKSYFYGLGYGMWYTLGFGVLFSIPLYSAIKALPKEQRLKSSSTYLFVICILAMLYLAYKQTV